jgi:hypothetical protein
MRRALAALCAVAAVAALSACLPEGQPYPYGYAGAQVTMAQLETKQTVRQANFEFWRRVRGLMEFAAANGVSLGVGTCWRVQPTNGGPGFASPGNSNHEGFPADGTSGGAVACDMVPTSSWAWMNANEWRFCLRDFANVNSEPWHIQPSDIPASRNYRRAPWVLNTCTFKDDSGPSNPPPPPPIVYDPWHHQYGLWPVAVKPTLNIGAGYAPGTTDEFTRGAVTYFNHVAIFEAGQYIPEPYFVLGVHSIAALQNLQRVCGQSVGVVLDQAAWSCVDAVAGP